MDNLPDEVLLEIFNFLNGTVLKSIMFVCKRWHNVITQSASTMKMLPLKYLNISNADELFYHSFHTMVIRHMNGLDFSKSIFEKGLGDSIQSLEISYCSLTENDFEVITHGFRNLNNLNLTKVKLKMEINGLEKSHAYSQNELILNRLVLLKVDHEILEFLSNVQTFELEITDCNENEVNHASLVKFVINQRYLVFLSVGEMSNNSNVFFHWDIPEDHKFKLKTFHSLFCSSHSHVSGFENNFVSFLEKHSETLENVKLSGKSLPQNIYKFVISSLRNLNTLELVASAIPQDNSFYENLRPNFNIKTLVINSTVTKNNINGLKGLLWRNPNIKCLDLMDTDEFIANDLFHSISIFLNNLTELSVLNFNKTFTPTSRIKFLEKFSIKIINNIEQLLKFVVIHESTLMSLSIWWIIRDFESKIVEDIIALPNLNHLKIGGRFIANKRIYETVKIDHKNLRTLHLIVNNYDEVKHLKFSFPQNKNLYNGLKCLYFEEYHDREPLND